MYFDGYWKDAFGEVPHTRPGPSTQAGPISLPTTDPSVMFTEIAAPRAAFPTYTFEMTRGTGMSLALPVHGVPVGFNYLNTDKATGTVTLLDAHTYSADTNELDLALRKWASDFTMTTSLAQAVEISGEEYLYLRVVTRVYLVGGVAVSLTSAETSGAQLSAGNAPAVPTMIPTTEASTNYSNLLNSLSNQANGVPAATGADAAKAAASVIPKIGGSVQFTQATSSGVSMNETFDHPLVIGYLGFDVAVDKKGELGPRVPTFEVVNKRIPRPIHPTTTYTYVKPNADAQAIEKWLEANGDKPTHHTRQTQLRAWLNAHGEKGIATNVWLDMGKTSEYPQAITHFNIKP